jgi:hypothetical protein
VSRLSAAALISAGIDAASGPLHPSPEGRTERNIEAIAR